MLLEPQQQPQPFPSWCGSCCERSKARQTYASMMLMAGKSPNVGCETDGARRLVADGKALRPLDCIGHAGRGQQGCEGLVTTRRQLIQRMAERGDSNRLQNNGLCKLQISRCQTSHNSHRCQDALP